SLMQAMTLASDAAAAPAAGEIPPAAAIQDFALLVAANGQEIATPAAATAAPLAAAAAADAPPAADINGLQNAPAPSQAPAAQAAAAPGVQQAVHSAVGSPRWANEVGNHLVMMSARGQQEGSLSLSPDHLGPLEVRISVSQNTANVWFGAQHADTRAALTEALPRLRELFADAGLALGHAGVSQQAPRQQQHAHQPSAVGSVDAAGPARDAQPAAVHRLTRGLVDTYA
ncbi:MAG: flagellar hook-length control protein FliK, partial [Steroidobacteraceae bacterium]